MELADILARKERALEDAVVSGTQEGLRLDFKADVEEGGKLFNEGRLTKQGRKAIGKAISAFSNSAGGTVVVGVACRALEGVDAAEALRPIEHWERALSEVSSAVGDLLQPKNDGINVHGFPSNSDPSRGYVVIDVPRSERRPHRCEAADAKQYFKRSGSASYAMEHYDIEDAFRRAGSPELTLGYSFARGGSSGGPEGRSYHALLKLAISNSGLATAKHVSLLLVGREGVKMNIAGRQYALNASVSTYEGMESLHASFVVNPGETRELATLLFAIRQDPTKALWAGDTRIEQASFTLHYVLTAENMHPIQSRIDLAPQDFADFAEVVVK